MKNKNNFIRKPDFLKKEFILNNNSLNFFKQLKKLNLNTVCISAKCPNICECFNEHTATFMLLGNICSRNCKFCNINNDTPNEYFSDNIDNIINIILKEKFQYVTLTSVTRDDLKDFGISVFIKLIKKLKKLNINTEILIPDLNADLNLIKKICDSKPAVINHNVETIKKLYPQIRPNSNYNNTILLLKTIKKLYPQQLTKTGFMLGLGESKSEIIELINDIKTINCDILTIGQYLQPSLKHWQVKKYYTPEEFEFYRNYSLKQNIKCVIAGSFVRSSYKAKSTYESLI